jgi:hypothetical protein
MKNSLLIDEPPIQVIPALAEIVGFNEAAVLQEIHYWLNSEINTDFIKGRHWVQNIFEHLCHRFFFWDMEDMGYMLAQFEQSGILMVLPDSSQHSTPIKYHTINYELLKGQDREDAPVKLVPVTPFIEDILPATNKNTQPSFTAEVQLKGPDVYILLAEDPGHFLACELVLEIQEARSGSDELLPEVVWKKDVMCHFPRIADETFNKLIWEDLTLYRIFTRVFQMKIMEQLLLFCADHQASKLVIFTDGTQSDEVAIYKDFLTSQGQVIPKKQEKAEIIIPADQKILEDWIGFMEATITKFRQTLWREQKRNPAIQYYLKSRNLSEP